MQNNTRKTFVLNPHAVLSSENSLQRFGGDNEIVIPLSTLLKIHNMKTQKKLSFGKIKIAKAIFNYLEKFNKEELMGEGVIQENGSILRIITQYSHPVEVEETLSLEDIKALTVCNDLKLQGKQVIFITNNPILRLQASKIGITAEEFRDELFPKPKDQYTGRIVAYVSKEAMDKLFKNKYIYPTDIYEYEKIEWITNMFVNIVFENQSVPAIFDGQKVVKIKQGQTVYGVKAKNIGQEFLLHALLSETPLVVIKGAAGTGKTFFSLAVALQKTDEERMFRNLLITRLTNKTIGDEKIGTLPGELEDKFEPYISGIKDNLKNLLEETDEETYQKEDGSSFFERGIIKIQPIGTIRGRTITNTIFIIDETQNIRPDDIKSIVTRAGEGSKFIFLGDPSQVDNPQLNERYNGLVYLSEKMKGQEMCIQLTLKDEESVRSKLARVAAQIL